MRGTAEPGGSLGVEEVFLGAQAGGGGAPWPCLTPLPSAATAAHFSFCRSLLEHTVSAENLSYRLQRNPGSSLTWHDGRSQRTDGGRTVKLLRQPGTEGSQVPAGLPHTPPNPCPGAAQGNAAPRVSPPPSHPIDSPQEHLSFLCRIRSRFAESPRDYLVFNESNIYKYNHLIIISCAGVSSVRHHLSTPGAGA